jgi:hypothetical protein
VALGRCVSGRRLFYVRVSGGTRRVVRNAHTTRGSTRRRKLKVLQSVDGQRQTGATGELSKQQILTGDSERERDGEAGGR